ncbi:glycosyl hydrolase family 65 protein [Nocardia ignorata]|uniref:Glycoside hydrolase family 65 C-terminal domain-containing protein n=1 Tax=Nocardia ignorata TaxID=145285 RepID=A0A4R6P2K6_NOCIG|nr:hypothetical protein DFR75_108100 [Nocardia ignorata]
MAGTADMGLRCYSGIETRNDTLRLHPVLPAELGSGELTISYRGQLDCLDQDTGDLFIERDSGASPDCAMSLRNPASRSAGTSASSALSVIEPTQ